MKEPEHHETQNTLTEMIYDNHTSNNSTERSEVYVGTVPDPPFKDGKTLDTFVDISKVANINYYMMYTNFPRHFNGMYFYI